MKPRAIRAVLYGEVDEEGILEGGESADMRFPGEAKPAALIMGSRPERERREKLIEPIRQQFKLTHGDVRAAFRAPTDAERHAARRLGYEPALVQIGARALWHRDFADERDARVGDLSIEPRSLQARRGLVTRDMLDALAGPPRVLSTPANRPLEAH